MQRILLMRSLIILEVEHGEDTDRLGEIIYDTIRAVDLEDNGATILDYTVRVDLPECFELES